MQTRVLKFGGSSLADAAQFRKAAAIIRDRENCRFVVASAPGKRFPTDEKVTDLLYRCAELLTEGKDAEPVFHQVENRYREIIGELGLDVSLEEDFAAIRSRAAKHPDRDYLASRGEYLNAKLLANYLGCSFVDAAEGIFFRADGTLDEGRTYETLAKVLSCHCRAVIPGFYGVMPDGSVHTFSRGGSDITGAIVARAAKAAVYENWTDVSGVMMADPGIVENPRVIPELSYRELRELASAGASVLHEEAIFPVREADIPINVRNTNAPADPGTMIVSRTGGDTGITGLSGKTGFSVIHVEKDCLRGTGSFGRKILEALDDFGIAPVLMPCGMDTMSVLVPSEPLQKQKDCLSDRIFRETGADSVTFEDGIALLSVVGRGISHIPEITGRLLTALASQGIAPCLMDQCESCLLLGIRAERYPEAVRAAYKALDQKRQSV